MALSMNVAVGIPKALAYLTHDFLSFHALELLLITVHHANLAVAVYIYALSSTST